MKQIYTAVDGINISKVSDGEILDDTIDQSILSQDEDLIRQSGIRPSFDKNVSYIACDGDKLVGILWSARNNDIVDMDIAIDSAYQSKKIGSRMIYNQIAEWKDEARDIKTTVVINCINQSLKAWLMKNGFKQHKMYANYVVRRLS